jgi:hypothetical protein
MECRKVEVTRYYAIDGKQFDDAAECLTYEREKSMELCAAINANRARITILRERANECRLRLCVAKYDALIALGRGERILFHMKMIEYYKGKTDYSSSRVNLYAERRRLNELLDKAYLWFGCKNKSRLSKKERREKSLRWRSEHTPDEWRTPNKIRVSKQPKEDNNEQPNVR